MCFERTMFPMFCDGRSCRVKPLLIVLILGLVVFLSVVMIQTKSGNELVMKIDSLRSMQNRRALSLQEENLKTERNELSKLLNDMKRQYGQQSCQMLKLRAKAGETVSSQISANGGWCAEISGTNSSHHKWDKGLSKVLSNFFKGKTVGSFGDGPGLYKKHIDSLAEVKSYIAYDGAPFCESTTDGRVKFLDLTAPHYGLPAFDWVISLEVAEHIPAKYEDIFVDNLVRHAKEGIVLSWAVVGQTGLSHVNNKNLVDVIKMLEKRHFKIFKDDGKPLRDASNLGWLKQNIHVYRRTDPATFNPDNI